MPKKRATEFLDLTTFAEGTLLLKIPFNEIREMYFDTCKEPTETLESYSNRQKETPSVLVNLAFFGMLSGEPCFNLIINNIVRSVTQQYRWGLGIDSADKAIVYGEIGDLVIGGCNHFVSGYPNLVHHGEAIPITFANEINYKAKRTAIGFNDSHLFIIMVQGAGCRLEELQQMFLQVGAEYAVNVDGGGSSRMRLDGSLISEDTYSRPVDSVFVIHLEEEDMQTFYRVQVGAFSHKSSAENLLVSLEKDGYDGFIVEATK